MNTNDSDGLVDIFDCVDDVVGPLTQSDAMGGFDVDNDGRGRVIEVVDVAFVGGLFLMEHCVDLLNEVGVGLLIASRRSHAASLC